MTLKQSRPAVLRVALSLTVALSAAAIPLLRAEPAAAVRSCNYFGFDFGTATNSTLTLHWINSVGSCVYSLQWRAGSGNGNQDPCAVNQGRLPDGWYDSPYGMINEYAGTSVRGRVWTLQDHVCYNGTYRTELFIHTEEGINNGQDCSSAADDPKCWDRTAACSTCSVATNDYFSEACIKVRRDSPEGSWAGDMGNVHSAYHDHITGAHNAPYSDLLHVVT